MLTDEGLIPMQCNKLNSDPTIRKVPYKKPKCIDEQVDRQNAIKQSREISKTYWHKELMVPDKYSAMSEKCITMVAKLESM